MSADTNPELSQRIAEGFERAIQNPVTVVVGGVAVAALESFVQSGEVTGGWLLFLKLVEAAAASVAVTSLASHIPGAREFMDRF